MKYTIPFFLSLALSQPLQHAHHEHEKRDLVTVLVTEVVTVNPDGETIEAAAAAATSSEASASIILSGSSFETVYTSYASSELEEESSSYQSTTTLLSSVSEASSSSSSSSSASPSASSSTSPSLSSSSSSSSSSSTSSYSSTSTGGVSYASGKGITYSPYTDSGSCKDAATITSDIEKLSQFELIRVYDTDCDCVSTLFEAKASNQKLFLGIYYLDKISDSVSIIADAVSSSGSWDDVYTVSVGNELVNSGSNTPSEIHTAVESARSLLEAQGYSGPMVSVDTLVAVQNNPSLCDYSDYIAVNSHPFWDGGVTADGSGEFLKTQIANIGSVCGGKTVLITETGWPTEGSSYGDAVPSKENQILALESIGSEVADQVILFTTYNDLWKDGGSYGVEKYWGVFD